MQKTKHLILGAGPSGLTLAHALIQNGCQPSDIIVLEKENTAGGLCRSETVDGKPLDIGGGHFLDVKHKDVLEFLFGFLPESEWNRFDRVSKIHAHGQHVDHPYEANLWQFDTETQLDYLESISKAGCVRGLAEPKAFADWIRWKFGDAIAENYMLPYNEKIWHMDPNELGTYWLYKLPNVSFRETLQSCLTHAPAGALPAHGVFLYPKEFGYGEVWDRMGKALGNQLVTGVVIQQIDIHTKTIHTNQGIFQGENIHTSIPWHAWCDTADIPENIQADIKALRNAGIDVCYQPETLDTKAHWIYEPDPETAHHRKLVRSNFCPEAPGYWTETNAERNEALWQVENTGWMHRNPYAYPINTLDKPETIKRILDWAASHGITGFGRWGTWEHMNSDIAVKNSLALAKTLG